MRGEFNKKNENVVRGYYTGIVIIMSLMNYESGL